MKRDQNTKHATYVAILLTATIALTWSCQKTTPAHTDPDSQAQHSDAELTPEQPVRLQYRDSILFYKINPRNYNVRPQRIPNVPGYFMSDPEGLKINASNGMIEVNSSESGLRYKVYYMSPDNQPVDSASVTIAGIDYEDGIFEINASPNHEKAVPVYKGTSNVIPCLPSGGSDSAGFIQCIFDETDLDGDGSSDVPGANSAKLRVNKNTGSIDLEQSLMDGVFGPNPQNGFSKDFTIFYRLDDASKRAINRISIRVYHFTSRDKIPAWLIEELISRKGNAASVSAPETDGIFVQSNVLSYSKPKRPPLIIIVSGYATL